MRWLLLLLLPMLPMLLLPMPAQALLHYRGETSLYQDTVWEGEVRIDGILTVAMGATLEIRPGTQVRFGRLDSNSDRIGESEIFVQGRLLALGSAERPIRFTSAEEQPRPGDWGALNMMMSEQGENLLRHCLVEYGYRGFHAHFSRAGLIDSSFRHNQRGAQFQESTVRIENCRFEENFNGLQFRDSKVSLDRTQVMNNNWGIRAVYVELQMTDCQVIGNRINGVSLRDSRFLLQHNRLEGNRRGLYLQRSRGQVLANRLLNNLEHGIYLEESIAELSGNRIAGNGRAGIKLLDSGGRIAGNLLLNNGEYALVNAGSEDFAVGSNWYGEPSSLVLPALVHDRRQRATVGALLLAEPLAAEPQWSSAE